MGKSSQRVQAERRLAAITPEMIREAESNPPLRMGDAIGSLQWTDFRTGKVQRWTVLRGDRVDRIMLQSPDGRRSRSAGWSFLMRCVRMVILGHYSSLKRQPYR
ncbi:MAG: hypothetical protein LLG20_22540 [Acidobacteriales bacterium]|nr:hypothetical protein [Terriglobales bacterium]